MLGLHYRKYQGMAGFMSHDFIKICLFETNKITYYSQNIKHEKDFVCNDTYRVRTDKWNIHFVEYPDLFFKINLQCVVVSSIYDYTLIDWSLL